MDGFIHFEGSKFCSNVCKNKYIEEEKENIKNIKKKNADILLNLKEMIVVD